MTGQLFQLARAHPGGYRAEVFLGKERPGLAGRRNKATCEDRKMCEELAGVGIEPAVERVSEEAEGFGLSHEGVVDRDLESGTEGVRQS